jgi:hypothetical protein
MTGNHQSLKQFMYDSTIITRKYEFVLGSWDIKRPELTQNRRASVTKLWIIIRYMLYFFFLEWRHTDSYTHGVVSWKTDMFISTAAKTSNYEPQFAVFGHPFRQVCRSHISWERWARFVLYETKKTSQVNWDNFQDLPDSRTEGST